MLDDEDVAKALGINGTKAAPKTCSILFRNIDLFADSVGILLTVYRTL